MPADEFDLEEHLQYTQANRNSLDDPWHRLMNSGGGMCPNPDCSLSWHGLPHNKCPGSFHFTSSKVILKKSRPKDNVPSEEEDWIL